MAAYPRVAQSLIWESDRTFFLTHSSSDIHLSGLEALCIPCDTSAEMLTRLSLRALRAQAPSAASAQRFFTQTSTPLTPHISRATQRTSQPSRVISKQPPRRPTLAYHPILRPSTHRAFTLTPHPKAQYNRYNRSNQYNRFNPRGSLIYSLIQNSKPHHYVIIGIGISGIYLYNTDVVSVSLRHHQPQNHVRT